MKKLTGLLKGLHFMSKKNVVIDTTHGLIRFPHLMMPVKTASKETIGKPQPAITDYALTIPPGTKKTITDFIDHHSEWNPTGTVKLLEKFTVTASLLISHSMLTIIVKRIAVMVTKTMESPYRITKNTQMAITTTEFMKCQRNKITMFLFNVYFNFFMCWISVLTC